MARNDKSAICNIAGMPIGLDALASRLQPDRSVLILGAGAAIPSGAPAGADLARRLAADLVPESIVSDDLTEIASIIENRLGRSALVAGVRRILEPLHPVGGMAALAHLPWAELYTTNFDRLIERAYRAAKRDLVVVRSNFEYAKTDRAEGTPLFKIHGCISQDVCDGHNAGMTLTERDYETYSDFRDTMFKNLELALLTKDVLIIGQSLRDRHLKDLVTATARIRNEQISVGRVIVLSYDSDADRAQLLEQRGVEVAFGGLDELIEMVVERNVKLDEVVDAGEAPSFPVRLIASSLDVKVEITRAPSARRLFNGGAASYADIADGLTFPRDSTSDLADRLITRKSLVTTLVGPAGVGKTTYARQLVLALHNAGFECWEHRNQSPLLPLAWAHVESSAADKGRRVVLLIDDVPKSLSHVNRLVDRLAKLEEPSLQLVLTANASEWYPRIKTPEIFRRGHVHAMSALTDNEVASLVSLMQTKQQIHELVDPPFAQKSRREQVELLRRRCKADMFVCLKNVFATEALDDILLREFAGLDELHQDIYRHVAFLEATGAQVHRQLVLRLLGIEPAVMSGALRVLEGIVDEVDIDPREGLFGWSTRHRLIARTIARYKFASDEERAFFVERVIGGANPSEYIEREMLRALCDRDFGIGSLQDERSRENLLRQIIRRVPSERVPRHRLIALLLDQHKYSEADREIDIAIDNAKLDPPLARFKVAAALMRANETPGIMTEDRIAIVLDARRLALKAIERFPRDRFAYRSYFDVGTALARLSGDTDVAEDAYQRMVEAFDELLDPDFEVVLRAATNELKGLGY